MRYAILSDIHGNFDALSAVLDDIPPGKVDAYVCLGDIVGYGAEPGECLARVIEIGAATVAGNHDYAAIGLASAASFNSEARDSVHWTGKRLSAEHKGFLRELPLVQVLDGVSLVHSTLVSPELFNYVLDDFDAEMCFERLGTPVCFMGHSHQPIIFHNRKDGIEPVFASDIHLGEGESALVNVGSVGQPRDHDSRACYALYDTGSRRIELRRVAYPVESAAQKIVQAGLPEPNAYRLLLGR